MQLDKVKAEGARSAAKSIRRGGQVDLLCPLGQRDLWLEQLAPAAG